MPTICVTGGTGFAGRGIVPRLLNAGFQVHALVRPGSETKLPPHANLKAFTGDVLKADDVAQALGGCDTLVHLVGTRRAEMKRTGVTYEDIDLGSVLAAIEAMKATGVKRIVLLSAASLGNSVYVLTKKRAEQAVISAGFDWTFLKPSFVLAPGQQWPRLMGPVLDVLGLLPGTLGDKFKLARNITREQLAGAIVWALTHRESIGMAMDVGRIREVG